MIADSFNTSYEAFDITLSQNRVNDMVFSNEDLVIIGMPTYGNRDYEDALLEQYDLFTSKGFIALGAATFVTEHSSTPLLAAGRPDASDLQTASDFGAALICLSLNLLVRQENLNYS